MSVLPVSAMRAMFGRVEADVSSFIQFREVQSGQARAGHKDATLDRRCRDEG
jgi:hypothetical protein